MTPRTRAPARPKNTGERGVLKGSFRITIEDSKLGIVGDSGVRKNAITIYGFGDYVLRNLMMQANSKQISHISIGSGTAASGNSALNGECVASNGRVCLSGASSSRVTVDAASKQITILGTFDSTVPWMSTNAATSFAIQNIGLVHSSTNGSFFAVTTFPTSTVYSNQNVNVTYGLTLT